MKALLCLLLVGCGSTGGGLVSFPVSASGPSDAQDPLSFTNGLGFSVTLTRARLHIAAIYFTLAPPISGHGETGCIEASSYTTEAFGPIDLDMLSPNALPFPRPGQALSVLSKNAEIWLAGSDINAASDSTVILEVAGTASKGGEEYPFTGSLTISTNRTAGQQTAALPGANPICKQRIVSSIAIDVTPTSTGSLVLTVDPRGLFVNVDFSLLAPSPDQPLLYQFADEPTDLASVNLYAAMHSAYGVYGFRWLDHH